MFFILVTLNQWINVGRDTYDIVLIKVFGLPLC